jgi:hypothetical protein
MNYETASFIATIAAYGISLIALVATLFSAAAAKESARTAADTLRHVRISELLSIAQEIVSDEMQIQSLCSDLVMSLHYLSAATGTLGGSRTKIVDAKIKEDSENASAFAKEGRQLLADISVMQYSNEVELTNISAKLRAEKSNLLAIKESMQRQLADYRQQQQSYRDSQIQSRK